MRKELVRFAAAGAAGFVVDAGLLYVALWLGAGYFIGRLLSFLCAVWVTWQINRNITFGAHRDASSSAWTEWWRYLAAMSVGGAVNYAIYSIVLLVAPKGVLVPLYAVGAGALVGILVNFAGARFWVFRRS
jgi:putative flippase GtrA